MLWRCYQTISSCFSCTYVEILSTWEVWRALKRLELLSAAPRATLTPLSCSPNFPRAQYLDIRTVTHELIVKLSTESWNLIDFQAQVSSVKDVCQNNRQLLYLFIYLFFDEDKEYTKRRKFKLQTAILISGSFTRHTHTPRNHKKQKPNSKIQNYWLTTKRWSWKCLETKAIF